MSIASELNRLLQAKSDLATSIAAKGVTVPAATTIDGYAALVDQIQTGGGAGQMVMIEYLAATGTQYIDTGITCSNTSKVEIKVKVNNVTNVYGVFGSRNFTSSTSKAFAIFSLNASQAQFAFHNRANNVSVDPSECHTYVLNKNVGYIDGVQTGAYTNGTFTCSTSALLFAAHTGSGGTTVDSRMLNGYVYDCKIWSGESLLRDFVPVRVGQVGYMYDRVSKTLFGNIGTGSFTLGPDLT